MNQELRDHIANLSLELDCHLIYEGSMTCNAADDFPSIMESHKIISSPYKTVRRVTLNQILAVTKDDFINEILMDDECCLKV